MTQEEVPPSNGLVAGKYELLRMIGRGGMGSVWEARHNSLGTHVAIKFIEKEYANNEEARKRFDNEARAAAALQSKHAIQIHDHGVTDDGKPYIVMEMLVGEPLDKRIERVRVMSLQETAHILQQVCRGLQKAHEQGIVHRDLKPENVFIVRNADDDEEIAKVLDFGIAKIRTGTADAQVSSSTRTGAVLGTPFYMSPEQARGLRDIDHRTDLWSLGVIAFKCTTGRLPFEGESLGDLLVKICTAPIPLPSQYNAQLPQSFDQWFMRALDREPNRRFGTASELAEALAYAAGISVRRAGSAPTPFSVPQQQVAGTGTAMGGPYSGYSPAPQYAPSTTPPYTPQPPYPMNVTSPPFVTGSTTSSGGGGSKGYYVFAAIAAILGIGLASWGVHMWKSNEEPVGTAVQATQRTADPPPTSAIVTPLTTTTSTIGSTAPTETTTATARSTATAPTGHPTGRATATNTATAPVVTYTAPTAHPTTTATVKTDFGAGF